MAVSKNFKNLSELQSEFKTGYIIVDNSLFEVDDGTIVGSWDLEKRGIGNKAAEARELAELSNRKRIVYDDEKIYDSETLREEGELITSDEAFERLSQEERDDWDSYSEYLFYH